VGVRIAVTTYLAGTSLQGAAHFARLSKDLEQNSKPPVPDDVSTQHSVYVISAVLLAVAALEGTINELFADSVANPGGRAHPLPESSRNRLAEAVRLGALERLQVLDKFQMALILTTGTLFETGRQPYQDAHLLVPLRNALVHYQPEPVVTVGWDKEMEALEKKLGSKFLPNPLTGAANPFFPNRCLGSGCAEWAAKTAIEFLEIFHSKIGLPSPHGDVSRWLTGRPKP
jgi:hypothetical protein